MKITPFYLSGFIHLYTCLHSNFNLTRSVNYMPVFFKLEVTILRMGKSPLTYVKDPLQGFNLVIMVTKQLAFPLWNFFSTLCNARNHHQITQANIQKAGNVWYCCLEADMTRIIDSSFCTPTIHFFNKCMNYHCFLLRATLNIVACALNYANWLKSYLVLIYDKV